MNMHARIMDGGTVGRPSVLHDVKCWPHLFSAIARGEKRHDLRRSSDRDYAVGDRLLLREYDNGSGAYTGRTLGVTITYVTSADMPCALSDEALHPNFCILSIALDPEA